ncbi:hypothetical protein CkaCkLH20_12095 [Colletotrichum karsti]|uniref:Uncharacterized protein n=1 Tax=Colletotrichum karsti TaxID=1095194 RepID=A0A9P6HT18_9PEZI|nr:uncharacterized protein CkaCkLH20_12095 [Colletotrichum karsti]KAF9870428.1 hypothetical protein CkaCkLH20_12095 [Colletotrichum karsti]
MSQHPHPHPNPSSSASDPTTPLDPPSARSVWIADNWIYLVASTAVAQGLHYRHIARSRKPNPNSLKNARFWALASGGWMLSYLGISTLVAVAQARVNHYRDPDNRPQYRNP